MCKSNFNSWKSEVRDISSILLMLIEKQFLSKNFEPLGTHPPRVRVLLIVVFTDLPSIHIMHSLLVIDSA